MTLPPLTLSVALSSKDAKQLAEWQLQFYRTVREVTLQECFSHAIVSLACLEPYDTPEQVLWKLKYTALRNLGAHTTNPVEEEA